MSEDAGQGGGRATGVEPGALSALLQEVAAAPEIPAVEAASLPAGSVVGRFEILRELGRGGFGVVYEARDRELGRSVALKLVRPGRIEEDDGKILREAEAIARLSHPNLVTLHDVGPSESGPYLVFEYLRGKTLQERMDAGPMPVQEAVHVATEVARGLAHAHAEGVVHRDLKPSNVFVTSKGSVKVLDFGMAHAFGRRRVSGGTPAYMAPEQWEDEPEDERTDVFALGVMLYRMLTGEFPFPEGEGRWAAEEATPRKVDVPGAPELADLVERMVDRKPKGRPRDGAAVLAALTPIEEKLRAKPADGKPAEHARRRKATLGDLLAELKRRHVFRVMLGYGVFAFAVLQVTEPIMHGAHLPDWVLTAVLAALALGFPVAVVLAWVYDLTAQGVKRTPSSSDPSAPRLGRSPMLVPLAVSAVVLAAVVVSAGGWYAWKRAAHPGLPLGARAAGAPAERTLVAVADFQNLTQDPQCEGLSDLLTTALEQARSLVPLTRTRQLDLLREVGKPGTEGIDEASGRIVAEKAGALLVLASIRRFDDLYSIDAKVLDPRRGEYLVTAKVEGKGKATIPGLIDRVAAQLRQGLRKSSDPGPEDGATVAAAIPSLTAYEHYFRGQQYLDKLVPGGAIAEFRKAVEIAPGFALAHYQLAHLGPRAGMPDGWPKVDDVEMEISLALNPPGTLPAKEKLLLLALQARIRGDFDQAHRSYAEAVDRYPQDKEVLHRAGDLYFAEKRYEEALPFFSQALSLDPGRSISAEMMDATLRLLRRKEELLANARAWAEKTPNGPSYTALARAYAARNGAQDGGPAVEAARRSQEMEPHRTHQLWLADAMIFAGQWRDAREVLQGISDPGEPAVLRSAVIAASQGRQHEALELLDRVQRNTSPYWEATYWRGRVQLRLLDGPSELLANDVRSLSRATAAEDGRPWEDLAMYLALAGDLAGAEAEAARLGEDRSAAKATAAAAIAWRRGHAVEAFELIRPVIQRLPPWERKSVPLWILGLAAEKVGHDDEALEAFQDSESWLSPASVLRSQLRVWRLIAEARILGRRGDRMRARERVDQVLAQLREADPDLPALREARAVAGQLAGP